MTKRDINYNNLRSNKNLSKFIKFLVLRARYNRIHPNDKIELKEILN